MSDQADRKQKFKNPFLDLWVRTSAKGTQYVTGFLGSMSVIGFYGARAEDGKPVLRLYLQEGDRAMPELQRPGQATQDYATGGDSTVASSGAARQQSQAPAKQGQAKSAYGGNAGNDYQRQGDLNDEIPFALIFAAALSSLLVAVVTSIGNL